MKLNINTNKIYKDYSLNEYKEFAIIRISGSYIIAQVTNRISDDEVKVLTQANSHLFSKWQVALDELVYMQTCRGNKPASELTDLDICLQVLGLTALVSIEQIKAAFRSKVKAAHCAGQFIGDMDALVQAKEQALAKVAVA